ncbi:hypothetical protein DB811_21055 [Xanthomonas perforans]|nr:hypothetical protein DB757_18265 [Xanthomonas perforans]RXD38909.1 hypothetical protein DB854_01375 [Xanthomonas perforans]RXD90768.1 hypothetical protein DB767_02380 [Xanthomonas perforans]RXD97717.1 hypothetical protein DB776_12875 [Xanthomonas perforans]RXE09952.1 hypothetical protein DB793_11960 [Xanthomonas perforans]
MLRRCCKWRIGNGEWGMGNGEWELPSALRVGHQMRLPGWWSYHPEAWLPRTLELPRVSERHAKNALRHLLELGCSC